MSLSSDNHQAHSNSHSHSHSHDHASHSLNTPPQATRREGEGDGDDEEEAQRLEHEYFVKALKSFGNYRRYHLSANHSRRMNYLTLPKGQRLLLDGVGYRTKLDDVDHGIRMNAEFLEEIAASGGMPFDLNMPEDESPSNSNSNVPSRAPSPLHPPSSAAPPEPQPSVSRKQPDQRELDSSQDRIRSTLRQFVRDWSVEGAVEREACYTPCLKALEEIWPNKEERKGIKVLVPGAGLGRLALEIARKGFASQGNEFSAHMLIASNFVLNETQSANQFDIFPYLHSFSNHLTTDSNLLKRITIPDVLPSALLTPGSDFSFVAGDWEEVYGGRHEDGSWHPPLDQQGQWGAVVTCFFIDCARNIINFLKIIHGLLDEDGIWVNLGPCLWHHENSRDKQRGEGSIELSLDELKSLARKMGFEISNEALSRSTYAADQQSMLKSEYTVAFWTAKKVGPLPEGI